MDKKEDKHKVGHLHQVLMESNNNGGLVAGPTVHVNMKDFRGNLHHLSTILIPFSERIRPLNKTAPFILA